MFKKTLFMLLISVICIFFCSQAIFADTTITDDEGNICVYDNASHLIKITLSKKYNNTGERFRANDKYLSVVVIPNNYTELDAQSFTNCYSLKTVYFEPDSKCKTIGYQCFANCVSLNYINLPPSLKTIGKSAFTNCYSLHLNIPNSVTYIGYMAFAANEYMNLNYYAPVPHIYYNGPASDEFENKLPKQLHKWGAARRN